MDMSTAMESFYNGRLAIICDSYQDLVDLDIELCIRELPRDPHLFSRRNKPYPMSCRIAERQSFRVGASGDADFHLENGYCECGIYFRDICEFKFDEDTFVSMLS